VRAVAATDSGRLAPDLAAGIRLREEWCANTPPAALQAMDAGAFRAARIPIRPRRGSPESRPLLLACASGLREGS